MPTAGFASCGVLESAGDDSDLAGWPPSPLALAQAAARLLLSKVCASNMQTLLYCCAVIGRKCCIVVHTNTYVKQSTVFRVNVLPKLTCVEPPLHPYGDL